MENSRKLKFIIKYIKSYTETIKQYNKNGFYDEAKLFELFASKVGQLYLGLSKPFINLNNKKTNFPCVDLYSEDGNIYCQVSTCKDIPQKILKTFKKIKDCKDEKLKNIKDVYFICLNNESINKVKNHFDYNGIHFDKSKNLITTEQFIEKAKCDLDFLNDLYNLLENCRKYNEDFEKFRESTTIDKKSFLGNIKEYIGENYYIDLSCCIREINKLKINNKFILITGEAGSGKSVLCKKILEKTEKCLCTRAEKLCEVKDVNEIWNFNIKNILNFIDDNVYIFIDSLENIANIATKIDLLNGLLERLNEIDNVYLLFTCRSSDLESFSKIIGRYKIAIYKKQPINDQQFSKISENFPNLKKINKNSSLSKLLLNPFYINNLVKFDVSSVEDVSELRQIIWNKFILKDRSAKQIIEIALERAGSLKLYSCVENYNSKLIKKLCSDDVLVLSQNKKGIRFKYDIFEDICFEQHIDKLFEDSKGIYSSFFNKLQKIGRCVYRRYQIWIENKLFSKKNWERFIYPIIVDKFIPIFWKKQSIIGIVKSDYCKDFFDKYKLKIIENDLLNEFVIITNIYSFEIDSTSYGFKNNKLTLKNKGFGRKALIEIIYENEIYKNLINPGDIKQLIFDYANLPDDKLISKYSYEIFKYYIDKELKNKCSYQIIEKEIRTIYKLYEVSYDWINSFFKFLKEKYLDKDEFNFCNNAIKDILSKECLSLLKRYSNDVIDFFNIFYMKKRSNTNLSPVLNTLENSFGLNENASLYQFDNQRLDIYIFFKLLENNFWEVFNWYLDFINNCVNVYRTNFNIDSYEIFFSKDCINKYFGTVDMWMCGECSQNIPALLSDMTFLVKNKIKNKLEKINDADKEKIACKIKSIIYKKSNNIIGLSIISNIGLTFCKELPCYCIELISSLKIVSHDLIRNLHAKIDLPFSGKIDYKIINPQNELRNYAINCQFNYPKSRKKIFNIFDYLYQHTKDDNLLLQLQYMDIVRRKKVKCVNHNLYLIESRLDGNAKNIHDLAIKRNNEAFTPINEYKETLNSFQNKTPPIKKVDQLINIFKKYKNDLMLKALHINELFTFISNVLLRKSKYKLSNKKRNEYCLFWIEYAKRQFSFNPVYIEAQLYKNLFEQLNEKIPNSTKNEIKMIILDSLNSFNKQNGFIFKLYQVAKSFLLNNPKYGHIYQNTIFALAKDEMEHQKFNYEYLCKYHKKGKINFAPNMQPPLYGVDNYIKQDGRQQFKTNRNEIIEKYLFKEKEYKCLNTDINQYDIRVISNIFSCGLNICDKSNKTFVSKFLKMLIEVYSKNPNDIIHIINTYELSQVEEFFKKCLLSVETYSIALDVLFNDIDFNKFTDDTIEFYLDVLDSMTPHYIDAYDSPKNRQHIQNVVSLMENHINKIHIKKIKNEFSKALILGLNRFDKCNLYRNLSKYKTEYSYQDKMFLNEKFSKYGYLNFYNMLEVVKMLHYDKLLPEILISISTSFTKYIQSDKNINKKIINFIIEIAWSAFVNHEQDIKSDIKLIESFENILSILTELGNKESAILLDTFRIH